MLGVGSSVWIDFFNGAASPARSTLCRLLAGGEAEIIVPDLVLYEVLRGFRDERHHLQAQQLLLTMTVQSTGGQALALRAATHDRSLRAAGITVRSASYVLLASFCIERGSTLLHADRDFDAFASLRGLQAWRH